MMAAAGDQRARAPLLYQASLHLLRAMALGTLIIGLLLGGIFHFSQEKAARREIRNALEYFSNSAATLEDRWQEAALRYKSRLEFNRLLENPATRWTRLNSYLTTQNAGEPFPALLVADKGDRVLFSFGFPEKAVPASFPDSPEVGWYYDPAGETLHRYYIQHIWLGGGEVGHLILFRPLDHGLLNQLASLNTHLFLRWQGQVVASSLGEQGRSVHLLANAGPMEHDGVSVEQGSIPWDQDGGDGPELIIHRQVDSLFDDWEMALGMVLGLAGLFLTLWIALGLWVYRTTRRILQVEEASRQFAAQCRPSEQLTALLAGARQEREDEINGVARSFASLMATVADRDRERDAYEASLRESEARVREITAVLADGVYVLDDRGVVTFANAEAERLLGWTAAELIGRNGHETFHYKRPDGTPIAVADCPVHQTIRTGDVYRSRNDWLVRKDGSILPVSIVSSPILRNGRAVGSVAAFHDITARLEAEQDLRESEERFRLISTAAMEAIIIMDDTEAISYWNPAAARLFGYGPEEALGRNLHQLIVPERWQEAARRGFAAFRTSGQGEVVGRTVEQAARRKDGKEIPIELSISALVLRGRWHALGVVRDISERKEAEHRLHENKARMRALLDASDESVLLLEPAGRILEINAFAARRFGLAPEAMIGRNFFDLMPPALAASRRAAVEHAVACGEPVHTQDQRGNSHFENSLYPVRDERGAVESVAIYAKDITEQLRARQVEDIFRQLDTVLLKWQMNLDTVAQMFCDQLLPVFGLAAAWIARAEKDGRLSFLARAEMSGSRILDGLADGGLRWADGPACCLPTRAVIDKGCRQKLALNDPQCRACGAAAGGAISGTALLLPLRLRGEVWGILAVYGTAVGQFDNGLLEARLATIAGRLGTSLEAAQQQEWLTLLDSALAGVSNAVMITAANAEILWANRAFAELSGYGLEELRGKTPRLFNSGTQDGEYYRNFWQTISAGKPWRGEVVNVRRDGSRYTANQTVTPLINAAGQVTHFVAVMEDISERKALEERIRHTAHFDLLTDLPNRGLFFDRLGQALALAQREGHGCALLFLDLDHFKEVNDQLGHAAGDQLLVTVAGRLREQVRASDTVARLAGDEFTVILPRSGEAEGAVRVAEKILAALSRPMTIAGREVTVGASIGIALFPDHGATVEQLLNAADHAMYQAKEAGRNAYALAGGARAEALAPG